MKDMPGPLLDEHVLRRALRLDADEVPARLDPALIAVASRAARGSARGVAAAVSVAFVAGWAWSEVFRAIVAALAAATGVDPLAAGIDVLAAVAVRVLPLVETAMTPAVPIAILAAAVIAAVYERRGRIHAATPS